MSNKRNGKAWVLYKTTKQAEAALEALDGLILNNRSIEIKRSLKKGFVPADTTNFTPNTRFTGLANKMEGGKPGAANSKYLGNKPPIKNAYSRK
jgi:RNA recognition motif-containing protein